MTKRDANDRDLIAAYHDGVSELTPDERRRVEAVMRDHPELIGESDGAKAMIAELRALPHVGTEPDWMVLEREIRAAVGPTVPSRWRWRWLVPIGALAVACVIAALAIHTSARPERDTFATTHDAYPLAASESDDTELWLDGHVVDDIDPAILPSLTADDASSDPLAGDLLPAGDLGWLDALDDSALDRAEAWLDQPTRKRT